MFSEFFVLILIAAGSVSAAWLLGVRSLWLAFPFGLAMVMALRFVTYTFFHNTGLGLLGNPVFFGLLGLTVIWATIKSRGGDKLFKMMAATVAVALLAVTSTRILGAQGTPHGDSDWILILAHLFDINGNLHIMSGHTPIKRGFIYPLMLALGPKDEYLSAFTPFIFAALASASVWLTLVLTKNIDRRRVYITGALIALVAMTAVMPLRAIFYINGHTATGLGILLAAGAVTLAVRDGALTRNNLILVCLGVFMVASARIEGIVLAALVVLPLLSRSFIKRTEIMMIISSATIPVVVWLLTYESYIVRGFSKVTHLPMWAFGVILIGGGLLPALKIFDWFRKWSVYIAIGIFAAIFVAAELLYRDSMREGNYALITNLIYGYGGWGLLVLLPIIGLLFSRGRKASPEYVILMTILLGQLLASAFAKMLDSGQFGSPTLGRPGWSDSLNRMWIHIIALVLVSTAVALIQNDKLWNWLPLKQSKITEKAAN